MGGAASTDHTPRNVHYLIGDTASLTPVERKLYSLSEHVLKKDDNYMGSICPKLGIPILTINAQRHSSLCEHKNDQVMSGSINTVAGDDINCDKTTVSEQDIRLQEQNCLSLYVILPLNKKIFATQTFTQWRTFYGYENLFSCCRVRKRVIYLQPIDNFPSFIRDYEIKLDSFRHHFTFFTLLQAFAEAFFTGMTVKVLPSVSLIHSKWNITARVHSSTGQKQLKVTDFHRRLKSIRPSDGYCIMGITWTDLYPTEDLNFILGEALNVRKTGIFCFGRYEPKSYNAETHQDITDIDGALLWRLLKVLTHETCHLFGLAHCEYFLCAMNESGSLVEAFSQPLFLCPVCLRKLQYASDFDLLHRYQALLRIVADLSKIYPTSEFILATEWLRKCMMFLQSSDDDLVVK